MVVVLASVGVVPVTVSDDELDEPLLYVLVPKKTAL
jgi:hypothetical protein